MKGLGMFFVMAGCLGIGCWHRMVYIRQWSVMQNLQKAFQILRGEIAYGRTALPLAFGQAAGRTEGDVSVFFHKMAFRMERGEGELRALWTETAEEVFSAREMTGDVRKDFSCLGDSLGYLDADAQLRSLGLYQKRLEEGMAAKGGEREKYTRLYPILGFVGGMMICLCLF